MESIFISEKDELIIFTKRQIKTFMHGGGDIIMSDTMQKKKKNARKDEPIHLFGWYNSLLIISCYSHYRGCTKPALTAWTVILFEITKQQFQIHCVGITEET